MLRYIKFLIVGFIFLQTIETVVAEELQLRIGSTANLGILALIAKNEGLFPANNLAVDYRKFQTGKITMDALISGDIEVGTIVDSNIAYINYFTNPIKVIASLAVKLDDAIYFKKNSGIAKPRDLIGKKIGFVPATTSHIFLARFLEQNQINWSDITPVILQPQAVTVALRDQTVDALSIWQPWGININEEFKNNIGIFSNHQDIYSSRILLATTERIIKEKPEALKNLLNALNQANEIFDKKPEITYSYLANEIGVSSMHLENVLKHFKLNVETGSSALSLVREIGSWINKSQESFKDQALPDYTKAFDDQFIKSVVIENMNTYNQIQEVSFCRPNNMLSALLFIAEAKEFLKKQGINAKFEPATNAKICQDTLLARKADYMAGGEGPFTCLAALNPSIKILAMLQQNPETSVYARKDRGITKFEDLKGKRVAYLPGTVSYFFLGRIMKKYHLLRSDVNLTAMQPPTMPVALAGGSIDAFAMWEPWGSQAGSLMSDNLINLTAPELYQYQSLLIAHNDAIKANPEVAIKIIRALIEAEKFIKQNDREAFSILSKAIAFEASTLKRLWSQYKHRVQIYKKPIKLMEDNFKLLQEDDFNFKDLPVPNFKSFVDSSFLKQVAPERVEF